MAEEILAVFEFVAENPPTAMIAGGILLALISVFTATYDPVTTQFLRNLAIWLIGGGVVLQILWLAFKYGR